jgi:hypothetical protein
MIGTSQLTKNQQNRVGELVSRIRRIRRTNANVNIMSTNRSYDDVRVFYEDLASVFGNHLPDNHRRDVIAYRIYLRQIADIAANNYAGRQRFHVNESRSPTRGKAFLQFIYFIETPKRNGRNAPEGDRGTLLLKSPSGRVREIVPEQGKFVFFSPDDTFHEVAKQDNRDMGSVSRNMIIGMLYRSSPNNKTVNRQIQMSPSRARMYRALAERVPLNSNSGPTGNANTLASRVSRLQLKTTKRNSTTPKRTSIKSKKPSKSKSKTPKTGRNSKIAKSRGIKPKSNENMTNV